MQYSSCCLWCWSSLSFFLRDCQPLNLRSRLYSRFCQYDDVDEAVFFGYDCKCMECFRHTPEAFCLPAVITYHSAICFPFGFDSILSVSCSKIFSFPLALIILFKHYLLLLLMLFLILHIFFYYPPILLICPSNSVVQSVLVRLIFVQFCAGISSWIHITNSCFYYQLILAWLLLAALWHWAHSPFLLQTHPQENTELLLLLIFSLSTLPSLNGILYFVLLKYIILIQLSI